MKRAIILGLLLLIFVGTAFSQVWFTGNLDEALAKAKSEKKLVLIDFYSPT
ncbi:MAG: hypothetical protein V1799_17635 [bacterium]